MMSVIALISTAFSDRAANANASRIAWFAASTGIFTWVDRDMKNLSLHKV
jgi:hypothetical protein